eukprot:scaffold38356_cov34-Phaeocystis_antarctica.AAC.2
MCWCVPAACASLRLAPACITTVDLACRYQLHALSSVGESAGDSPRLLAAGWLCFAAITLAALAALAAADAAADAAAAAPGVVTFSLPPAMARRRHCCTARCRERCDIEETA